jgi:iron-only hydrogenase group A
MTHDRTNNDAVLNDNEDKDVPEDNIPEVTRRSFIQAAGAAAAVSAAAAAGTGCTGKASGGTGWIPHQYEKSGNFPVQVRGRIPIDPHNPSIQRDDQKCILCGQCAEVCEKIEHVHNCYELPLADSIPCIHCGQCTLWCPTGAITEKDDTARLFAALDNPHLHVVCQTAPSTRIGLGEEFGLPAGTNVEGQQVSALKALGFDTVLDTNFAADMTIMEEAMELVLRITGKTSATEHPLPQFTSCCPAWVKFCEMYYPDLIPHLSTARSPMGMLGPIIKTYYAEQKTIDPKKIVSVSIMPCTAKKFEMSRPEMNNAGVFIGDPSVRDSDIVITTRELARMIKSKGLDLTKLEPQPYDKMLSEYTGAGAIFGATGGVMEAAVRSAYRYITKKDEPLLLDLKPVRGLTTGFWKEAEVDVPGARKVKVAVISGMENAVHILDKVRKKEGNWDFIEFMACPGGCIAGGGQPKTSMPPSDDTRKARISAIYSIDDKSKIRICNDNPEIVHIYKDFFDEGKSDGGPCGHKAHELLHTHHYEDRTKNFTAKKV